MATPKPSTTNSPSALPLAEGRQIRWNIMDSESFLLSRVNTDNEYGSCSSAYYELCIMNYELEKYLGGFSLGVPPLPIPNREVKPERADGTAPQCGRVGRRLLERAFSNMLEVLFCAVALLRGLVNAFLFFSNKS